MLDTDKNPDRKFLYLLGAITLVGFFLRLHGLWSESITADEADTLYRIKSSRSVRELLEVWVRGDGHPPFIHLLEYFWTKVFGISEGAVRFPFALMGTGAIWFAGRTSRFWFGTGTAIAVAAGVAFLQFPLMYSQLARPYSPGLFFSMMLIWYWSKWLFGEQKKKTDLVFFVIAGLGAAYSHYFSLLMAGLIGMSGIFFLRRETWKGYFIAGASVVLLFLPYTKIFIYQLGVGGVGGPGGWLGKPTPSFLSDHIWFIFDESRAVVIGAFALSVITIIISRSRPGKFHLLAFVLWATPLLIGYFYSQKSPVLQNSVLLFSFPFLLMLLFAWIPPPEKWKWSPAIPGSFAIVLLMYVTVYKPFHLTDHFGRLRELVETAVETQEEYSKDAVDVFFNVDIAYFLEYNELAVGKYPQNVLGTINSGNAELSEFRNMVENSKADYFVYGWSTRYSPLEILPIIREKFPHLVEKKEWFNSAVYVFCKYQNSKHVDEKGSILFCSRDTFGSPGVFMQADTVNIKPVSGWSAPCRLVWSDTLNPMKRKVIRGGNWKDFIWRQQYARLDSNCVYSPLLKVKAGDILKNPDNQVLFTIHQQMLDTNSNVVLVIEFQRDGKQLFWNGRESAGQIDHSDWREWQNVYFGLQLPKELRTTDTVSFYCYSKNGLPVLIDYLDVKTLKGHQGIYGPRADLK